MTLQRTSLILLAAASLSFAASAHAEIGVTADLGTTGVGAHIVVPMEKSLNGRFGINYLRRSFNKDASALDYHVKAELKTFDAIFDWYPGSSPFHVSAGVVYNGNQADAKAKPNSTGGYTINGTNYAAATVGNLSGTVDYRKAAPYLGVGWGNALTASKKLSFSAELGALFQGSPKTNLVSIGCTTSTTVCKALASDVAAENVKFAHDIEDFKVYPVLRVSVNYAF